MPQGHSQLGSSRVQREKGLRYCPLSSPTSTSSLCSPWEGDSPLCSTRAILALALSPNDDRPISFVICASSFFRHSCFVIRHSLRMLFVLAAYLALIVLASLGGGWLTSRMRLTHTGMQLVMSFVAGLMLGVCF